MAHIYFSPLPLSHPPSQANIPASKKWLNGTFLNALKKVLANGDLTKTKGSYKLMAHFKNKAAADDKPKKALKKKGRSMKEKEKEEEISFSSSLMTMVAERYVLERPEEACGQ